jgi:hypothetical protein
MIPAGINRHHVLAALSQIDREGITSSRQNRSIALRHSGKSYPPKLVLSVASEIATGQPLASSVFITSEAERFLMRLGFSLIRTPKEAATHKNFPGSVAVTRRLSGGGRWSRGDFRHRQQFPCVATSDSKE